MAPATVDAHAPSLDAPDLYLNRELSWLAFNARVLAQARDESHPLLERVKFLAIVGTNLDEFFMIRVSTTQKKLREGIEDVAPDGYSTEQQLDAMRTRALGMLDAQASCWADLRQQLAGDRIQFLEPDHWTSEVREYLGSYFLREIYPVVTPLAFDPGHPFPLVSNLSKNFAVVVRHGGRTKFARVKVPDALPRFIALPEPLSASGTVSFVFLEDVIRANIHELFPGTQVKGAHLFRIIRDTDLEIEEDEANDLLESVDRSLKQLRRGAIALLHVEADMPTRVLNILVENFEVTDDVVLRTTDRLGFGDWGQLTRIHRPELKDAPFQPRPVGGEQVVAQTVRCRHCRSHASQPGIKVGFLLQDFVDLAAALHGALHQLLRMLIVEPHDPVGHVKNDVHEGRDCHAARDLAGGVASHSVGHDHQIPGFAKFGRDVPRRDIRQERRGAPSSGSDEVMVFVVISHPSRV
jgi:polyphosphate kinase